jgi:hypothetical protein
MSHDHQVFHLKEMDRRKFLNVASSISGLAFLNALAGAPLSEATIAVSLPGFAAFSKSVRISKNSQYYLVESDGIPTHQMMVRNQELATTSSYRSTLFRFKCVEYSNKADNFQYSYFG